MGNVAFVFPGQGAQSVGMGKEAFEECPEAKAVFETANEALGESLSGLCFEGPDEALRLTANTQPAVLTTSVALLRAFGEVPDVTAGHSLGEYTANVCAGTLDFADAVRIVRVRGTYMQEAVPDGVGAMAAIMGLERGSIDNICAGIEGAEPVNYNSPKQTVIAGSKEGVEKANAALREAGGKVIPLAVSAPFHSTLMKPAEERLSPHLAAANMKDAQIPIYVNVEARALTAADSARDALVRQVSRSVRWQESVEKMIEDGVTLFVEIGPGRVLSGLIARIDRSAKRANIQAPKDFDKARAAIAEARGA